MKRNPRTHAQPEIKQDRRLVYFENRCELFKWSVSVIASALLRGNAAKRMPQVSAEEGLLQEV
ncbi:MAG: hypothetical protein ACLQPD_20605 [Desulfomonilaceae bacterium]